MTLPPDQATQRNRLLASLSASDFALLAPHLQRHSLDSGYVIETPHQPVPHVYFPEPGVISIVAQSGDTRLEAGIIGPEGVTGLTVVLGIDSPLNAAFVQISCRAWRIPSADLRRAMAASHSLHERLLKFVYLFSVQLSHTALCNGRFHAEKRLARWLLMCHDRADREDFALTQEFLATMLGIRRAGVTVAAQSLIGMGALRSTRGSIGIIDRDVLLNVAGDAYGMPEAEYERVMIPALNAQIGKPVVALKAS